MICHEYRDRVDELVDGLLPPEESGRLHAHAAGCDECTVRRNQAERFRDLLANEGAAALQSWEAARLALAAATDPYQTGEITPVRTEEPAPPRVLRYRFGRLAAAAVLVASAGFLASGLLSDSGPQVLAMDELVHLASGESGLVGGPGRLVLAETRNVDLVVRDRDGRFVVDLQRGDAQFRVDAGLDLFVATKQGEIESAGAVFLVDVRGDGAVAVDVQSGRVVFAEAQHLYRGDRLEVDPSGRPFLVSRARFEQLVLERKLLAKEVAELRDQAEELEEHVAQMGAAAGGGDEQLAPGDLPFDALGAAQWTLLDRRLARNAVEKQDAMALLYRHAAGLRERFGVAEPWRAVSNPAYVAEIAGGLFRAVAPEASDARIESVAAATRNAMTQAQAALDADMTAVESGAALQRAFLVTLRSVETELGVEAAATFVRSFPRDWQALSTFTMRLDDRTESTMVDFWKGQLDLDNVQSMELRRLVRVYMDEAQAAQRVVSAMLPAADADRLLYGRREMRCTPDGAGGARGDAPADPDHESPGDARNPDYRGWGRGRSERDVELGPSETVASKLREMDALLRLAEPRIRFETALRSLLRADQIEKGFRPIPQVLVFRPAGND